MVSLNELMTTKQQEFMFAEDKRINILSGSVRSGKTYISLLKFACLVANAPKDRKFIICGVTLTSLKRNCLDLLVDMVGQANFWYSLNRKEGKLFGRQVFIEGAGDSTSEQKIRGMTLAGAYCDEITLYKENFVMMLLSRLSVKGAKLFATCNPDAPTHYVKERFIDNPKELDCAVWNFKLTDNTFLDEAYVTNLMKEYTGVFYDRYVLGEWVKAEGLIFPMYDETLVDEVPFEKDDDFTQYCMSMDYGTQNAFVAMLWGLYNDVWYGFDMYYYSGRDEGVQKTDDEYWQDVESFLDDTLGDKRPQRLETIIDPSAASFIVLLQKKGKYRVKKADNEVINGLRNTASVMKRGKIKIVKPRMEKWIKEAQGYAWDEKKDTDVPIKENDHAMDATRYFVQTKRLAKIRRSYDSVLM